MNMRKIDVSTGRTGHWGRAICIAVMVVFMAAWLPGQGGKEKRDASKDYCLAASVEKAPEGVKVGLETITGEDAGAYVSFIASDLMEGRLTAGRGYAVASHFAATLFKTWGILPAGDIGGAGGPRSGGKKPGRSYFQNIPLVRMTNRTGKITMEYTGPGGVTRSRVFLQDKDYQDWDRRAEGNLGAPVVFGGYGLREKSIGYDDYKRLDVKGKWVLVLPSVPGRDNPDSPFNKGDLKKKYASPRGLFRLKVEAAGSRGAVGVLMVEDLSGVFPGVHQTVLRGRKTNDREAIIPGRRPGFRFANPIPWWTERTPAIGVSRHMADVLLGYMGKSTAGVGKVAASDFKSCSSVMPGVFLKLERQMDSELVQCRNVLGYIEGSGPELKKEAVVICAHLDHDGKRGGYIFNGADDNGSGSAALLEIAHAFAVNPVKPKRSVIFALLTGEEPALLGSRYYVAHPFFPLDKTLVCLNLDMMSRQWSWEQFRGFKRRWYRLEIDKEKPEGLRLEDFLGIEFSGVPALRGVMERVNRYVGLDLHFQVIERAGSGGDHAPFDRGGVPWFITAGAFTDHYHAPSDEADTISLRILEKGARLTFLTAFEIAEKGL